MNQIQFFLIILKPDTANDPKKVSILKYLLCYLDIFIVQQKTLTLSAKQVDDLYQEHLHKDFYQKHAEFMQSNPVTVLKVKDIDPQVPSHKTTRRLHIFKKTARALFADPFVQYLNAVHCSVDENDGKREVELFFPTAGLY